MDFILIKDLTLRCILGVDPQERRQTQEIRVNLKIFGDFSRAARSDRFQDSMDYRALKKKILKKVEASKFFLIEALAEHIADICLQHPLVKKVTVRVEKPAVLRFARSVGIQIHRRAK